MEMREIPGKILKVAKQVYVNVNKERRKPVIKPDEERIKRENAYAHRVRQVNPRLTSLHTKRTQAQNRRTRGG
jgi:hypothetical protein